MTAQPMHNDINHFHYKLEAAEKLTEVVHEKYTSCIKDRSIGREFQNLQNTIKLANSKAKELKQEILDEEKEIQMERGNKKDIAEKALTQLGKTVWDDVFKKGNLELPSTGFMEKVKQAVMESEYQQLMKEILKKLQDNGVQFCKGSYSILKEAKNKLYAMLTEIIAQEAGSILDHNIRMKHDEKIMIRVQMNKIEY